MVSGSYLCVRTTGRLVWCDSGVIWLFHKFSQGPHDHLHAVHPRSAFRIIYILIHNSRTIAVLRVEQNKSLYVKMVTKAFRLDQHAWLRATRTEWVKMHSHWLVMHDTVSQNKKVTTCEDASSESKCGLCINQIWYWSVPLSSKGAIHFCLARIGSPIYAKNTKESSVYPLNLRWTKRSQISFDLD